MHAVHTFTDSFYTFVKLPVILRQTQRPIWVAPKIIRRVWPKDIIDGRIIELRRATQEPDRPRLLLVIQKERPMCQTTDQMVAPAVLD